MKRRYRDEIFRTAGDGAAKLRGQVSQVRSRSAPAPDGWRRRNHAVSAPSSPNAHLRTFWSDNVPMTGNEFIRKLKALGKARQVAVRLDASRGKGSHQTLYFGAAFTIIRNPKDELKTGTFHAMCAQLGIKASDL